jgi:hypothetical protein
MFFSRWSVIAMILKLQEGPIGTEVSPAASQVLPSSGRLRGVFFAGSVLAGAERYSGICSSLEMGTATGEIKAGSRTDGCGLCGRRPLTHEPEVVLSVLVVVLGFNGIARGGCCLGQGKISITTPLPITDVLSTISTRSGAKRSFALRSADEVVSVGVHCCFLANHGGSLPVVRRIGWPCCSDPTALHRSSARNCATMARDDQMVARARRIFSA